MLKIANKVLIDASQWEDMTLDNARLQCQVKQFEQKARRLAQEIEDNRDSDFWTNYRFSVFYQMYQQMLRLSLETHERMEQDGKEPDIKLSILEQFHQAAVQSVMRAYRDTDKTA